MKTKGFFARVSVVLAIILAQSVAQDSQDLSANQAQNVADSSVNQKENALDSSLRALRFAQNDEVEVDSQDSRDLNANSQSDSNAESTQDSQDSHKSHTDSHDDYEVVDIGTSTIRARAEYETYQSGSSVGKNLHSKNPPKCAV